MMLTIIGIFYLSGAAFTLIYLIRVGRPALSRRILQLIAAAGWPAYWLAVQGVDVSMRMLLRIITMSALFLKRTVTMSALFLILLILLPFWLLEQRHQAS